MILLNTRNPTTYKKYTHISFFTFNFESNKYLSPLSYYVQHRKNDQLIFLHRNNKYV